MRIVRAGDLSAAALALRDELMEASRVTLRTRSSFNVAVAGGSLIQVLAEALQEQDVTGWHIFMVDERMVPLGSKDSNCGALMKALEDVSGIVSGITFHPVNVTLDVAKAAFDYAALLPDHLDIALMGMGPDGHIASLFPSLGFSPSDPRSCIPVSNSPKPPAERVTMSVSYLSKSERMGFVVMGQEKRDAWERVLANDMEFPASHLPPDPSLWIVDDKF